MGPGDVIAEARLAVNLDFWHTSSAQWYLPDIQYKKRAVGFKRIRNGGVRVWISVCGVQADFFSGTQGILVEPKE